MTHRSFVADATFHHVLMRFALHGYGTLTDPAADDRSAAAVRAALRRVRGWRVAWDQRAGERGKTWREGQRRKVFSYR